jgi:hypothetical protein
MYFSWLFKSLALNNKNLNARNLDFGTKLLWHQKQTLINTSQVEPVLNISNYFIITLLIALLIALHIDIPLLGIVSDLLHFYILVLLIAFSYAMRLRKYQKELQMSLYCHIHFSYLCSIKVVFSLQIVEKSLHSPLVSSLRKRLSPTINTLLSNSRLETQLSLDVDVRPSMAVWTNVWAGLVGKSIYISSSLSLVGPLPQLPTDVSHAYHVVGL